MLKRNVLLKNFTNYKIGGIAKYLLEVSSLEDLRNGLTEWQKTSSDLPFVLGEGTNLLVSDDGYDGLVVHNLLSGIEMNGGKVQVGSGVLVKDLIDFCVENSLSGIEWAGGLPGTVGGAIRGNAGAFKGETKDNIIKVTSLDYKTLDIIERDNSQCGFGYRTSVYKKGEGEKEFIISAVFNFKKGNQREIKREIEEKVEYRKNRHPLEYPNAGSVFKNIPFDLLPYNLKTEWEKFIKSDPFPIVPVVKILLKCDLWEKRVGGAKFSDKHPNFIVNTDNAKASDVKALIEMAKKAVKEKFNIQLEEEIIYLGNFKS
ncbi:UDP-N-acetylmuramate dehydrogenase [Patescibacteria group bacterium]|nr:UDP-N-acetylmuramate dehydrogenase [Patescibacteria group bacterium]